MTIKCRPIVSLLLAATVWLPSAFCQGLPATNMGKFVHQPGDNQYQPGSQLLRHGSNGYLDNTGCVDNRPAVQAQQAATSMPAYTLAPPPPPGPDVSIEPIVAEEPVPPPGFPPLPLALDLPITMGYANSAGHGGSWKNQSVDNGGGGGGGGGGSGGGYQGSHGGTAGGPGYNHFSPGAFSAKSNGGGGGGGGDGSDDGGNGGGASTTTITSPAVPTGGGNDGVVHSGYKCRTPPPIMRTDTFNNQTSGGTGKGAGSAATNVGRAGAMGKAPGLDDSQDAGSGGGAPDAPAATGVFQTQSEDLTLPDDEYTSRYFKDGRTGKRIKNAVKQGASMGRQMLHSTGVPIGF